MTGTEERQGDLFATGLVNQELARNNCGTQKFHLSIILQKT
jgi:hypothetical protein